MSNVHGLFSNRDNDSDDNDSSNNRYVGGISARGGGSGLAVEPTPDDLLSSIRANAETPSNGTGTSGEPSPPSRTITLYRSGFTIDNGPLRRLDDPSNSEFLRDLAKGVVPRELQLDDSMNTGEGTGGSGGSGAGSDRTVGLVDKRHMEHGEDGATGGGSNSNNAAPAARESFMGEGQSLGTTTASASGGIIAPPPATDTTDTTTTAPIVIVDETKPTTVIQVRLLNGRKLRITINTSAPIRDLVNMVNASGDAGTVEYVLSAGFPPKVLEDLGRTVEECGLCGSQVVQKKA